LKDFAILPQFSAENMRLAKRSDAQWMTKSYGRPLTEQEVKVNLSLDQAREFGELPEEAP
jgi:hypothetical protein